MKIKVEHVFSNRKGFSSSFEDKNIKELLEIAEEKVGLMIENLKRDEKIKIIEPSFREVEWSKTENEEAHEDVRSVFYIEKKGRTKFTERDVYRIVNDVKTGYFSKVA